MVYNGWSLFDKILLICRQPDQDKVYQAYLCDPNNKKQIENARNWGQHWDYGEYDKETKTYPNKKLLPAIEFEFENNGFELQLYDSANGSSQGGKLSFWDCLVTKDGKTFEIGINSDLLLYILLSSTFINGKCTETVSFARCKGGVGVLHKGMKEYQAALNDMSKKQQVKKKTSKHIIGHNYITLTEDNVYLGDFYQWYKPIYEKKRRDSWPYCDREEIVGLQKLKNPIVHKLFPTTQKFTSTKEYFQWLKSNLWNWDFKEKLPARTEGNIELKLDATNEDWEDVLESIREKEFKKNDSYINLFITTLSTNSKTAFDFSDDLIECLAKRNVRIEE